MKVVPICEPATAVATLRDIFHGGGDDIVVVLGEQDQPLGTIALSAFVQLFPCPVNANGVMSPEEYEELEGSGEAGGMPLLPLIQPVAILPSTMTVAEFLPHFQSGKLGDRPHCSCALVDEGGKFLGLLDGWQLLQQFASLEVSLGLGQSAIAKERGSLLAFIDKLPIPLLIQTAEGKIQHRNLAWQMQVGTGIDSDRLPGETATDPKSETFVNAWCNLNSDRDPEDPNTDLAVLLAQEQKTRSLAPIEAPRPSANVVWQFIKFPLDWANNRDGNWDIAEIVEIQTPLWLVLATDITEQRQLCKELAAKNADLVQLNRLKDEFLACISHELKTPLTAVLGLSSLLKDNKLGELTQRQSRYAHLIYQSGRQLMTVVNDILDLTRLEAGQLKLSLAPVKLKDVCDRAIEQTLAQLSAKEEATALSPINFALEIEPGLEVIIADELRLRQMLVHLLDNAVKFTPANGNIGLKVGRWEGWIDFTVWDTGIGIPEASQHLIFQKFQQLESPLTRQHEGTGLGLVLTQRLAIAHGGDISFISKVGQGSRFTLLLPPNPRQKADAAAMLSLDRKGNPLVMIVESTPRYIEEIDKHLRGLGYRVAIARSGTEALEKARQLQPGAILINPLLPLLSGWDVLTLLKSDAKTQRIPTIVMATAAERSLSQQNHADGFLTQPVEKAALQECLYHLGQTIERRDRGLTILRLNPDGDLTNTADLSLLAEFDLALSTQSSHLNYRLLATDDLEQAEILARVWKPQVLLLDGVKLADPLVYVRSLSQHQALAHLPVVTLDAKTTAAANQTQGLSVFPCLIRVNKQSITALLQVIQIAAGMSNQPYIAVIGETLSRPSVSPAQFSNTLVQYLQKAGLKSNIFVSWTAIYQQIQDQRLNAIVLELPEQWQKGDRPFLSQGLRKLAQSSIKPPILVIDRRFNPVLAIDTEINTLLAEVATKVITNREYSCADALLDIHQVLPQYAIS
ncbi:MAG: hybrid sensor histidine kinase/response regulator [Jaaginema sp. PMC 1079.18]|nr:hybrid sensor histidine kinase/response regulator [Jaaginema sp. PMC 1080.18]MEC4852358.1 hybrid sensor histidine kinase/response regulator [Jaaginema sp. PMC 1079.18]MEC4868872.1 hybrid sensor histidine kinase/response regulator [Jaaginema sp. PMC 1078.18]